MFTQAKVVPVEYDPQSGVVTIRVQVSKNLVQGSRPDAALVILPAPNMEPREIVG